MSSFVTVTVDTTPPAGVTVDINSGAARTSSRDVSVAIASSSGDAAQVLIYGDVDPAANPSIQATEGASTPITLASPHSVRLSAGDGAKTVRVKVLDDVGNKSGEATDSITVDTTAPTITVGSGPTRTKVSSQAAFNSSSFDWSSNEALVAYEVRVVPTTGSDHTTGTQVPTTGGSTNVSGGATAAGATVTTTVKTADLLAASAGDSAKIIKVFGQDADGNWSAV